MAQISLKDVLYGILIGIFLPSSFYKRLCNEQGHTKDHYTGVGLVILFKKQPFPPCGLDLTLKSGETLHMRNPRHSLTHFSVHENISGLSLWTVSGVDTNSKNTTAFVTQTSREELGLPLTQYDPTRATIRNVSQREP